MDKAIYIAMTGGAQIERAQTVHANNLANATTTGFRADLAQARAMAVYYGDGLPTRAYAMAENPATDLSQGAITETGNSLDVAVSKDGWIAVQAPDGSEAYTREGSLKIDALGQLTTASGLPVLGEGGPIAIPPAQSLEIGGDGTITIRPQGQNPNVLATVDRIKLVRPEPQDLQKGEDGLLRHRDGLAVEPDASITVQSGFVEGSNVNAVNEMTEIISLARQFEIQLKMMKSVDDNSASATRLLQMG